MIDRDDLDVDGFPKEILDKQNPLYIQTQKYYIPKQDQITKKPFFYQGVMIRAFYWC